MINTFSRSHILIRNTEVITCFSAPVLMTFPDKSEFTAGENVTLYCSFISPYLVKMYYFFHNQERIYSGYDDEIIKSNLKPEDSGSYTCMCGLDLDATPESNVVSITVVGKLTMFLFFPITTTKISIKIIIISTNINTKMCVCLCFRVFLGHLESDWDTVCQKVALRPRMGSKTIIFQKKLFFAELLPFF